MFATTRLVRVGRCLEIRAPSQRTPLHGATTPRSNAKSALVAVIACRRGARHGGPHFALVPDQGTSAPKCSLVGQKDLLTRQVNICILFVGFRQRHRRSLTIRFFVSRTTLAAPWNVGFAGTPVPSTLDAGPWTAVYPTFCGTRATTRCAINRQFPTDTSLVNSNPYADESVRPEGLSAR